MKRFGKGLFVFVIASLGLTSSCAVNEFDLEREVYERQIKKVSLGMSLDDFQSLFPKRISRGANQGYLGTLLGYEVACAFYSLAATGEERRNDFTGTERIVTLLFRLNDRLLVGEED